MKKLILFLFLSLTISLNAQWLEQMMYLPDSFSGCAISRVIIWNQVNDQLYFPWYHTVVTIDCETNEKIQPIRTNNALDPNSFAYNSANNCLYSTTGLISSVCTLYAINCQNRQVVTKTPIHFHPNRPSFHSNSLSTNPISNKVYLVINDERSGEDSLFIIDAGANQIKGSIGINADYWQPPLFNPNHNVTYIFSPGVIYVLDGITDSLVDTIETYPITQPYPILLDTIDDRLYCRGWATGNKILQINCSSNQVIAEISIDTIFDRCEATIDPINHKLYISPLLGYGKTIWVIDANHGSVEDSICTEFCLAGVKYCPMNNRLYVTTRGRNYINWDTILVINPVSHQIVSYIDIGKFEPNLTGRLGDNVVWFLHPLSNKLYISLWSSYLCIIDCETNQIIVPKIILGIYSPGGFLWNPITNRYYCTDKRYAFVHCFDANTNRALYTRELPIPGYGLCNLAVATLHNKIYIGFPDGVVVLDGTVDTVIRVIWLPTSAENLCYNPTSDKIYTTPRIFQPPYTCIINCVNDEVIAVINTISGSMPFCNPRTNKVYVTDVTIRSSYPTYIIDGAGDTLIASIDSVCGEVAFREIDERVYISQGVYLHSLVIIDGWTNRVIEYVPDIASYGIVYNSIDDRLYPGNYVIDCITNIVLDTLPIRFAMLHNPVSNKLYAYDTSSLIVVDGATNEIINRFNEIHPSALNPPIWNNIQNRIYAYDRLRSRVGVISDIIPGIEEEKKPDLFTTNLSINLNPFNKLIKIEYEIAFASYVTINVYDVTGKFIRNLCNDFKTSGKYETVWYATDNLDQRLSSGIYFLTLQTKDRSITKKIVIAK